MNKKIISSSILVLLCSTLFYAAPKYISPNNDGVQDTLDLSLKISDKRFVQAWSLVIEDTDGNVVKVIENKISLPEKLGFKSFFKQLFTPKQGVNVPDKISWNGAMENGETAPDGLYHYYVTATDDNDNVGRTESRDVFVDTEAPEVVVTEPSVKVFGEGERSSIKIKQSGTEEVLWVGQIKDASGNVVKRYTWNNEIPTDFIWTGTNENGTQVMDGVYSYEIAATDKAGNKSKDAGVTNIIYSASKPTTNIYVEGSKYFSPGTASPKQNINFALAIEIPEERTGNKLTDWKMEVRNKNNEVVRTYNNKTNGDVPPSSIVFDGKDENGNKLPDGEYRAQVSARYLNGYEPAVLYSPYVVLSTAQPNARIEPSQKVFGAGSKSTIDFDIVVDAVEGAPIKNWKGAVKKYDDNTVIKSYDFGEYPPEKITWDGLSDDGLIAESGKYYFEIEGEDMAGNIGGGKTSAPVTFDTTESQLLLALSDTAFSPNGDQVRDSVKFTPVTMTKDVVAYDFEIKNENDLVVYSSKAEGKLPVDFVWNGKGNDKILCADGTYTASLKIFAENGSDAEASTQPFVLDTIAPSLVAEIPYNNFSTNGNGNQKNIPISIKSITPEKLWSGEVRNDKDIAIRKFSWRSQKDKPLEEYIWDGRNDSGNVAADGVYSILMFSTDDAGNSFQTEIKNIVLDNRETKAYVTSEHNGISPNNDGFLDSQVFGIKASVEDSILSWNFDVKKEDGTVVYSLSEKDSANLPSQIIWNGADLQGNACEGTFSSSLNIKYLNSNTVSAVSAPFVCTATAPKLTAVTFPEYFSPDNDGVDDDLYVQLTCSSLTQISNWSFVIKDPVENDFWRTEGKSWANAEKSADGKNSIMFAWDGLSNIQKDSEGKAERVQSAMDYPFVFTVSDDLGMTSVKEGVISIDVLVIRDGNVLKMAVPSIIFEPDGKEFMKVSDRLSAEQVEKNIKILDRIAVILKKFSDYKVTIAGHANKITDNPLEETEDNLNEWGRAAMPLSKERADVIKEYLVSKGVSSSSLSTVGKGGTEPVADCKDDNNKWKNRRVEFILRK